MNAVRPIPLRERTTTFRAWVQDREIEGCTALAEAETFEEAIDAVLPWASHKQNVSILRHDAARREKLLHVYTIKRESQRKWRTDPVTRVPVAYRKEYPVLIHTMAMDAFEPARPFDAFRDDAVGVDRSIVEVRHG